MAKQDDLFFRKIDDPVDFRKAGLEALRETIHAMRRFDAVKKIRTEKVREVLKLRDKVQELNVDLHRLHDLLPDIEPEPKKEQQKARPAQEYQAPERQKGREDIDELETQLKEIEKKLKDLNR
ncbi:hypothetical protein HYS47_04945 [Candidatus Woesearchaeota archaeon]|nr:hypothetical protein [Candidatus Woesearchaeota archaeon]